VLLLSLLLVSVSFSFNVIVESGKLKSEIKYVVEDPVPNEPISGIPNIELSSEICILFENFPDNKDYDFLVSYEFRNPITSLEVLYPNSENHLNEFSDRFEIPTKNAIYQIHDSNGEDMNGWDSYFFESAGIFYVQFRTQASLNSVLFILPDSAMTVKAEGLECMQKYLSIAQPTKPQPAQQNSFYPRVSFCTLIILFVVVFVGLVMTMFVFAVLSRFGLIKLGRLPSYSKHRMQEEQEDDEDDECDEDALFYEEEMEKVSGSDEKYSQLEASAPPMPQPTSNESTPGVPLYYVNHGGQWFAAITVPQTTDSSK